MAHFAISHGSWQGAWCWDEVVPLLRKHGHSAMAMDLPAHGNDSRSPRVVTLQDYVDSLVAALRSTPDRSILVGHSMSGQVTMAAEAEPDRVKANIYVSGILPPNGVSMMNAVRGLDTDYLAQITFAADGLTADITAEGALEYFYNLCAEQTARNAVSRLKPEPVAPFNVPITTTSENFGRIPRYYIECLQDRAIPIAVQRTMQSGLDWRRIYSIDSDHSPFFSAPAELASVFNQIATDIESLANPISLETYPGS